MKITDIAMCKPQYRKDYAEIGGRPPAPIRWLPWESILLVSVIKHLHFFSLRGFCLISSINQLLVELRVSSSLCVQMKVFLSHIFRL